MLRHETCPLGDIDLTRFSMWVLCFRNFPILSDLFALQTLTLIDQFFDAKISALHRSFSIRVFADSFLIGQ